mmetsp:Transcript_27768/g.42734  ORF Transcript_27768/g.42734 Transcript_27768/m.42734 type:complete len:110 (-) Transcript_27768:271-600(-)
MMGTYTHKQYAWPARREVLNFTHLGSFFQAKEKETYCCAFFKNRGLCVSCQNDRKTNLQLAYTNRIYDKTFVLTNTCILNLQPTRLVLLPISNNENERNMNPTKRKKNH